MQNKNIKEAMKDIKAAENKVITTVKESISNHCWIETTDGHSMHIALDSKGVDKVAEEVFDTLFQEGCFPEAEINAHNALIAQSLTKENKKLKEDIEILKEDNQDCIRGALQDTLTAIRMQRFPGSSIAEDIIKSVAEAYEVEVE